MSWLPQTSQALPLYIGAGFCVVFSACFFAVTVFLGGILAELRRGAFKGYRVKLVKAEKSDVA